MSDVSPQGGFDATDHSAHTTSSSPLLTAEDAQLGDEYISLTFHESESEDEDDDEDEQSGEDEDVEESSESHPDKEADVGL